MKNKGVIFNIQRFSIHDGPGIRTTIFLKGCPLKCKWCANPESQLKNIQISLNKSLCIGCKACINICPNKAFSFENGKINFNNIKCVECLKCISNCPTKAIKAEGQLKEIEEIVKECIKDKEFYEESNGGVTISGGEPFVQSKFLKALVNALKEEKINVAIETTGYIESNIFKELAPMFDLLLFDIKHYDSNKHFNGTGVYNILIINNLKWALANNLNVLPRIPVIPNFNNSLEDASGLAKLLKIVGAKEVQLLPFHQFGEKKYELLNKPYSLKHLKPIHKEDLEEYKQIFIDNGINCFF
ncbi:glycyl-radical enzyme activating protein [Clostridium tarantellae]|uniref:Glycyl-radical enzyme activating protein n=1 Tax=Clostridium tarantellae TaxID=39493 RepID=A0A6I1MJW4_9CLOT|nr:glycyl-radical enzyme activating protein [Clostridium tarantellae]MPQ42708.1 glycyl-radical enzyme activating protein [Clostridium tarantellae]